MTGPFVDRSLARQVEAAVIAVPGVSGVYGGVFGEIATYLPGGRVAGIELSDTGVGVHIVVDLAHDLRAVAARVADVATEITGLPASVTIEDITTEDITASPFVEDGGSGNAADGPTQPRIEVKDDV
ncbi:MAG: Asp23/Gls24 family envelope stress response protein [Gordonia sp. (in: high G+C Gram-positive bacteria)]